MNKFSFVSFLFLVMTLLFSCELLNEDLVDDDDDISGTLTDPRDGRVYETTTIGSQIWLAENMAYLPLINNVDEYSYEEPRYYVYNFEGTNPSGAKLTNNYQTYGVLYNWKAASEICPDGWHLPTDAEWESLAIFIDTENNKDGKDESTNSWSVGRYLKSETGWFGDNTSQEISDKYNFTALPAGWRDHGSNFNAINNNCMFWSATKKDSESAYMRALTYYTTTLTRPDNKHDFGVSVRCVKD